MAILDLPSSILGPVFSWEVKKKVRLPFLLISDKILFLS